MDLWFSGHARDRMRTYDIDRETVEQVIARPDDVLVKAEEGCIIYDATLDGRRIGVVVAIDSNPLRVITVMLTRRRYRRR